MDDSRSQASAHDLPPRVIAQNPVVHDNNARPIEKLRRRFFVAIAIIGAVVAAMFLIAFIALLAAPLLGLVALALAIAAAVYGVKAVLELTKARSASLLSRDESAMHGLVRFVSWDPTEGVILLRNKDICHIDDNPSDGGGFAMLLPFLGEEIALRVPLEIQTLGFTDTNVLTREYVELTVKCTVYWRIASIERFFLFVSGEIHYADDRGTHSVEKRGRVPKIEAAETWLRKMAEEETRRVISRVSTGLLLAARVAEDLASKGGELEEHPIMTSGNEYKRATESLAAMIFEAISEQIAQYGLELHRVALQEVVLPPAICEAATDAAKSAYLPLQAEREAAARRARKRAPLEASADVIGKEATAAREILDAAPDSPLGALAGIIQDMVVAKLPKA